MTAALLSLIEAGRYFFFGSGSIVHSLSAHHQPRQKKQQELGPTLLLLLVLRQPPKKKTQDSVQLSLALFFFLISLFDSLFCIITLGASAYITEEKLLAKPFP